MGKMIYSACEGKVADIKALEGSNYFEFCSVLNNYLEKVEAHNKQIEKMEKKLNSGERQKKKR